MPTYCVGDVQGCYDELIALLTKINFDLQNDQLWFTGDLVNRGPKSLQVLRFVKSLGPRAITVLGNHDLHLLAVANQQASSKKQDTLDEILKAHDSEELCDWLRKQPLLHHDANLQYTMTHAGLPPHWDLIKAQQCADEVSQALKSNHYLDFLANMYGEKPNLWSDNLSGWPRLRLITNYLTRMRLCNAEGELNLSKKGKVTQRDDGFLPWFKISGRQNKNLRIVFGHWAALEGITDEPDIFAVDTGCVWGNCLTALRLEDQQRFSIQCDLRAVSNGNY